jgi:NADH-quinone oxidoreductase subunit N
MIALLQIDAVILRPGEIHADAIYGLGEQLVQIAPLAILAGTALFVLLADILLRLFRIRRGLPMSGSLTIGLLGSLAAGAYGGWQIYKQWGAGWSYQLFEALGPPGSTAHQEALSRGLEAVRAWRAGTLVVDQLSSAVAVITCAILAMTFLVLLPYLRRRSLFKAELAPLVLLSGCGALLLGMSRDLLITFIAIEILSLPLYVLCGLDERRDASRESSLKYFLLGAFASGFFIYGAALIYGAVGHLSYGAIDNYFSQGEATTGFNTILLIGIALVAVGLAFKLALVPFQAWLPDVYQGAPTPITAFMASAVKLGVFVAALRFIFDALGQLPEQYWRLPLAIFAVASMVVGNLFALHQMSLKRLLAYSAITHTGYLTLALCVGTWFAAPAMLVYLIGYYLSSFGAFALIAYLAPPGQDDVYLDELSELGRRAPGTAASMVILILSMVGMPLTAGFIGKLLVFTDAWRSGLQWLVIIAVLNSVLSAFFYLRVLRSMYLQPAVNGVPQPDTRPMERGYLVPTAIAVGLTLVFGILPDFVIMFSRGTSPY